MRDIMYSQGQKGGGKMMKTKELDNSKKDKIDKMTQIWTNTDEYGRGFLDGVIRAAICMASTGEKERPVA